MATEKEKKKPLAELFSDKSLNVELPMRIGAGWKELLIYLDLSSVDIYHISHDNQVLKEKIGEGLMRWNSKRGHKPELERAIELTGALKASEMTMLADELDDEYCLGESQFDEIAPGMTEDTTELPVDTKETPELADTGLDSNGDIMLRDYQREIAEDGLRGDNSIIWAGTGSGKTRVAVYIMKNHLDNTSNGKIAFFTTTLTLLDQQYEVICKLLPKYKNHVITFSGRNQANENFSEIVNNCRVCVITPMFLDNYLRDDALSLDVFSMLVLDECHHTRKKNSYNQIMARYRKLYIDGGKSPQIIGLTASVGTERARDVKDAEKSIIELMARMNVTKIATPKVHVEEYKTYVPDPIKHTEEMKDRHDDRIGFTIQRAMEQLERWLLGKLFDLDTGAVHALLKEKPDTQRMKPQYQTWLSRLQMALPLSKQLAPDMKHRAIVITDHLTMYQDALCCNYILCMRDVLTQLNLSSLKYQIFDGGEHNDVVLCSASDVTAKEVSAEKDNRAVTIVSLYKDVIKELESHSKNPIYENPNIIRLQKMVDDNFTEKGKDSIFMVFVETKASATAVSKYLTEKSSFARCEHLISSRSTSGDNEKQSQADHGRVIKRLLSKQINGVVATQVAEEGLDIPACNLVIRYNNTRNEISTVQVAGRSRAKQGTVTDFANTEKRRQEDMNVIRLTLMNDALSNILVKSDTDLQLEVRQRMRTITAAEAEEAHAKELHQQSKTEGNFTLRCGKCQETAVRSCDIRCYNGSQYVVIDKEYYYEDHMSS
ncbi:interferon-induced helicase C domain-containing protein 1-like [Pecten maximus]|uniref:interferon-induced helicase C domain-containing protein 1-like n=1 Tax=Pecten maximus TaxID=6579 RepID=UPI0014580F92|nr:interferon-induced helicase C domain-containing protein 1-like [Pecten maximus]